MCGLIAAAVAGQRELQGTDAFLGLYLVGTGSHSG